MDGLANREVGQGIETMSNMPHSVRMLDHQLKLIIEECRHGEERIANLLSTEVDEHRVTRIRKVQQHVWRAKTMAMRMQAELQAEAESDTVT